MLARRLAPFALAVLLALSGVSAAGVWVVDAAHTTVAFHVRQLFSEMSGRFERFEGRIRFDETAPEKSAVEGTIEAASIDTKNEKRDAHLRSVDYFDVERHPRLSFRSTRVSDIDRENRTASIDGMLTIRGNERPVTLVGEFLGRAKDPSGSERARFRATITIDRKDYGLRPSGMLETGGVLVGDEVRIEIEAEAVRASD